MKSHDAFLELAAAAIDFDLTPVERGSLERHLASCPACTRSADALYSDARSVAGLPPVRLSSRLGDEILAHALHPTVVRRPLRLLAVAALLGLLIVGSFAVGSELVRRADDDLSFVAPVPSASPQPNSSPAPNASPVSDASSVPSSTAAASMSPSPSLDVPPVSSLRWEAATSIPDSRIDGLIGFRGGYVAYGATGPQLRPAAWFSADGQSWAIRELAGLAPCSGSEPVSAGYVTAGATDGDQIVLVGARWPGVGRPCGETWPAVWVTSDGLDWQVGEAPVGRQGTFGEASGVWTTPGGWEAFTGIDLQMALWQSRDSLAWTGPASFPDSPEANLVAAGSDPNGVRLMAVHVRPTGDEYVLRLLESSDGKDWKSVALPAGEDWTIRKILPPSTDGRDSWVVVTNESGADAVIRTSIDRARWTSAPFPMPAVEDLDPTRYGLFAVGMVPSLDTGGPTPAANRTQFVSQDGLVWTKLTTSVNAARLADGPAGVIGLGPSTDAGKTSVWRLVETGRAVPVASSANPAPTNGP